MKEEERKAIEKLKTGKKIGIYELIRTFKKEGIENFVITRKKYIDIILNLIEKLQKELNQEKEKNKGLRDKSNKLIEVTNLYLNSVPNSKIREQLKKLDNMKVDGEVFTTAVNFAKKILQDLLKE